MGGVTTEEVRDGRSQPPGCWGSLWTSSWACRWPTCSPAATTPPAHPCRPTSVAADVVRTGQPARRLRRVPQPDGSHVWVLGTGRPTTYDGRPAAVMTLTDVTAEHEAQLRAEASERRLQQILDAVDASVFTKDREGRYTFVNRAFELEVGPPRLGRARRHDGRPRRHRPVGHRRGASGRDRRRECGAAGRPAVRHRRGGVRRPDPRQHTRTSTTRPAAATPRGRSTAWSASRPTSRAGPGRGVTGDRQRRARVRPATASSSSTATWSSAGSTPAAARNRPLPTTGCWSAGCSSRCSTSGRPGRRSRRGCGRPAGRRGGGRVLSRRIGDTTRVFAVRAFPIRSGEGVHHRRRRDRPRHHRRPCLGGGAPRPRAPGRAHAAPRGARADLAGGVAHDFNNLLGAIGLTAEMLTAQLPAGSDERAQAASIVEITRTRLPAFTQQLLVFARKDATRLQRVDVNAVVHRADQLFARTLGEHVERRLELTPGEVFVDADPARLEQVVVNLAINARDAMPDGGTVLVRRPRWSTSPVRSTRRPALARLACTSCSASPTAASTWTRDPAARRSTRSSRPSRRGQGTGLGPVDGLRGREPERRWRVRLRRARPRHGRQGGAAVVGAPARPTPSRSEPPSGTGRRVAVVEDEAALREVARRILAGRLPGRDLPDGPALLAALEESGRSAGPVCSATSCCPGCPARPRREAAAAPPGRCGAVHVRLHGRAGRRAPGARGRAGQAVHVRRTLLAAVAEALGPHAPARDRTAATTGRRAAGTPPPSTSRRSSAGRRPDRGRDRRAARLRRGGTARGLLTARLRARSYNGRATYRTQVEGWYLKRNRTSPSGADGQLLRAVGRRPASPPGSPVSRSRPSPPPLVVGAGGRDGESIRSPSCSTAPRRRLTTSRAARRVATALAAGSREGGSRYPDRRPVDRRDDRLAARR